MDLYFQSFLTDAKIIKEKAYNFSKFKIFKFYINVKFCRELKNFQLFCLKNS